jgi:NAD(P)H-dependent flavin oxidoreductase YrpB (nitropropane dioxygenase family)
MNTGSTDTLLGVDDSRPANLVDVPVIAAGGIGDARAAHHSVERSPP